MLSKDEEGSSDDGEQTLDLSVSKDADGQEQSTTSSAGNSVSEFDQNMLMRKNLEDLSNLQMQVNHIHLISGLYDLHGSLMRYDSLKKCRVWFLTRFQLILHNYKWILLLL